MSIAYVAAIRMVLVVVMFSSARLASSARAEAPEFSQFSRAESLERDVSYFSPPEVLAGSNSTITSLHVVEATNRVNGIQLLHRTYNGGLVGPTIRVNPGQSLRVRLKNDLAPEAGASHSVNIPHGFNTTNLHTHGLHVSPSSPADDVFLEVAPGTEFDYVFNISADHPAGTFWYHAHKHGSTALQLASGMAGALIVRGGLDDIPEIRVAEERIMVLQQFTYKETPNGPATIDPELLYSGEGDIVEAVNGVVTPTITMRPGEVQRWRIIHAGTSEAIFLDAEGVNFHEIAVDGLATGRMELKNSLQLYPGYRSDVLVIAPMKEGARLVYSVIGDADKAIRHLTAARRNVLRIVVKGEPKEMALPSLASLQAAAPFDDDDVPGDDEIVRHRTLRFSEEDNAFLIDGKEFDPGDISQWIQLDTAEEWELISDSGTHPFHIHVNPFAIKPTTEGDPWLWRDTVVIRKREPVVIRTRFQEHTGKTVLHCHNLTHEDRGMMQAIKIVDGPVRFSKNVTIVENPGWIARDETGRLYSDDDYQGKVTMVVLHRGVDCIHCAAQLARLKEEYRRLSNAGIRIVAISPHLPDDEDSRAVLRTFPFPVLTDAPLECFRRFECLDGNAEPLHGVFLIDGTNRVLLSHRTETALSNVSELALDALKRLSKEDER